MNTPTDMSPSSDEKLMGAVSHLFGPLVAIVVWSIQKDKSHFVKFQALQALSFDVILIVGSGLVFFCVFGVIFIGTFGSMFGALGDTPSTDAILPFIMVPVMFPFLLFACIFPFSFLILAVRLVASISILNGRNYQYPLLGKWLENFLKD